MARGIRAVRDRIDMLLTTTTGLSRPLAFTGAPLRKEIERAMDEGDIAPEVRPSYVLRWVGDRQSAPIDQIVGPLSKRQASFQISVSVFRGGGELAGSDTQETDALLADIWEDVVQVLEDPNNLNRTDTGWLRSFGFVAGVVKIDGDRASFVGRFDVDYDVDLGAL